MRDDFSTIHLVQRNKVAFIFTFAFGTEELLLVSEPSSSFPSSSKVVVIGDFNKGQKRLLYVVVVVRAHTLSLSLFKHTNKREKSEKIMSKKKAKVERENNTKARIFIN